MNKTDQSFIDEFKPIPIPSDYHSSSNEQEKVIYCLAAIDSGTAVAVALKIHEYEPMTPLEQIQEYSNEILSTLFNKGLIKGEGRGEEIIYNLSKITTSNKGHINPDLIQ